MNHTVLDTIGRTPIVRLQRLAPEGIAVYAKLEARNPGGSVKDRLALEIIEDAERSGALRGAVGRAAAATLVAAGRVGAHVRDIFVVA